MNRQKIWTLYKEKCKNTKKNTWKTVQYQQSRGKWESKIYLGDFPGGPVVKLSVLWCRGPGFDPWSGNEGPTSLGEPKPTAATTEGCALCGPHTTGVCVPQHKVPQAAMETQRS